MLVDDFTSGETSSCWSINNIFLFKSDALLKKGISGLHRQTNKLRKHAEQLPIPFRRYQDTHNQISIMVMASARWLGVRLDVVASLIVGSVAAATAFVAQDAGKY